MSTYSSQWISIYFNLKFIDKGKYLESHNHAFGYITFGYIFEDFNNPSKMKNYIIITDETGARITNENGLTLIQNVAGNSFSIFLVKKFVIIVILLLMVVD